MFFALSFLLGAHRNVFQRLPGHFGNIHFDDIVAVKATVFQADLQNRDNLPAADSWYQTHPYLQ